VTSDIKNLIETLRMLKKTVVTVSANKGKGQTETRQAAGARRGGWNKEVKSTTGPKLEGGTVRTPHADKERQVGGRGRAYVGSKGGKNYEK